MRFATPEFLWAYLLVPFFILLYIILFSTRKNFYRKFGDKVVVEKLLPKEIFDFRPLKAAMFLLAFSLLIFALARPLFGVRTEMVERRGIDIFIALDISNSMLAEDIAPNRIRRAKFEIARFIDMLSGDRVGLIIFAGTAFTQMPLTLDYGAAKMFLEPINTDWISSQGTDIAGAIKLAQKSFPKNSASKVMIIISDGEEMQGDALRAAKSAAQEGIIIHTVGIGSESGVPIPVRRNGSSVSYLRDRDGNIVMTRLDPKLLEQISIITGGKFFLAGVDLNFQEIYKEIAAMEKNEFGAARRTSFNEQYQLFLFAAIILFILEFFLSDAIRRPNEWKGRFSQ